MLVLSHAYGLRINLHQFCQRILETAGNGGRASLSHVELGEFLRSQLACGIYGSARFIYDNVLHLLRDLFQQFHDEHLRFPGRRSISYRNQRNIILLYNLLQQIFGRLDLLRRGWRRRIDDRRSDDFSGRIHHRQLAASAECRIPSKNGLPYDRRLHQKLFQILFKYFDGPVLCPLGQLASYLPFNGRRDQALVTVFRYIFKDRRCIWILSMDRLLLQIAYDIFFRRFNLHRQELFLLSPVQRKNPVSCQSAYRLFKVIIHLIDGFCLLILGCRDDSSFLHGDLPDPDTVICLIRYVFGNDIFCACNSLFYSMYFFVRIYELFCQIFHRLVSLLKADDGSQRLQPLFFGNRGPRPPLRPVWAV